MNHSSTGERKAGGELWYLPCAGRLEDSGTGNELGGKLESRAQNETRSKGGCAEEEGAGGWEYLLGCRISDKERPF